MVRLCFTSSPSFSHLPHLYHQNITCHWILPPLTRFHTACCPTGIFSVNTTSTTSGMEQCEYLVCNITGYALWAETASCIERTIIVEDHEGSDENEGNGVKGCAFNSSGATVPEVFTSAARRRRRAPRGVLWVAVIFGVILFV